MACENLNNANKTLCPVNTGYAVGGLISADPFEIPKVDLEDIDAIKALIVASEGRIIPLINEEYYESVAQREAVTKETTNGITKNVSITGHSFKVSEDNPGWYAIQKSILNGAESRVVHVVLIKSNGYYEGNAKEEDANVKSRRMQLFKNVMEAEDNATNQMLDWTFTELQPKVNLEQMYFQKPADYSPLELYGVTDVVLEVVSSIATEIVATVQRAGRTGSYPTQLAVANFELLDGTGAAQTISGVAYANGQYTLSGTGLVSGTLQVKPVATDLEFLESEIVDVTI